jgi:hypothetical protein
LFLLATSASNAGCYEGLGGRRHSRPGGHEDHAHYTRFGSGWQAFDGK